MQATSNETLTMIEACATLHISPRTFARRVKDGSIRVVKLGGTVLVNRAEMDRILGTASSD
jgi:excisionase family DNA binding protein